MLKFKARPHVEEDQQGVPFFQLRDLILAGGWQTAFFTSYSLSLSYFEAVVLHALRRAGVRAASIAVDLDGYRSSLSERGVGEAGRAYSVVPMSMPKGIFHPKLMVLEGEAGLRATVGSGNLTYRGWGGNLEVVEYLNAETEPEAFADLAEFLEKISSSAGGTGRLACDADPVPEGLVERCRAAARGARGSGTIRVLHSMDRSMGEQVVEFAADLGRARRLRVVSPFLSVDAIHELAILLDAPRVSVCVPERSPEQFDFKAARRAGLTATPVTANEFLDDKRALHAKILEIVCERGRLTLAGSVNATRAALLSTDNVELAVLRITDRPTLIRWRKCDEPKAIKATPPVGNQVPCLVARYDQARVVGRIIGVDQPRGTWRAVIELNEAAADVDVDEEGRFAFLTKLDLVSSGRAAQLVFSRGAVSAAGWLMLDQILAAIRERGRTAEAIARLLAGSGDADDLAAILAFFAENPDALAAGSSAHSSTNRTRKSHSGAKGLIDLSGMVPVDAVSAGQARNPGGTGESAFERLLVSLRHRMDSDEADVTGRPDGQRSRKQRDDNGELDVPPPQLLPNCYAERTLDALFERVKHEGAGGRQLMRGILAFVRYFSGNLKEPDDFVEMGIGRWLDAALSILQASGRDEPDDLDRAFAAVVTGRVITKRISPSNGHGMLQRWHEGLVPPDLAAKSAPTGSSPLETWLAPEAAEQTWRSAWRELLATDTRWAWARSLADALQTGTAAPELPSFLSPDEANTIRRAFSVEATRRSKLVAVAERAADGLACPIHNMALTQAQAHRFRAQRIASTRCCPLLLLNVDIGHERADPA